MSRSVKKVPFIKGGFIKGGSSDRFFKKSWHRKARAEWRSASLARKSLLSDKSIAYSNVYDSTRDHSYRLPTQSSYDKSDRWIRIALCK